jgi:hypothetical protein
MIAMMGRTLPKSEWKAYFDHLSKHLIGERAEVEIAGLKAGGHIEARWVPLIGITYEPKGDVLEIALERLDHFIRQPRNIVVTDSPEGLETMDVVDTEGVRQVVRLMKPLRYPRRKPSEGN